MLKRETQGITYTATPGNDLVVELPADFQQGRNLLSARRVRNGRRLEGITQIIYCELRSEGYRESSGNLQAVLAVG